MSISISIDTPTPNEEVNVSGSIATGVTVGGIPEQVKHKEQTGTINQQTGDWEVDLDINVGPQEVEILATDVEDPDENDWVSASVNIVGVEET